MSAAEAQCRPDHRVSVSTQTRPGTAFSMPPKRKGAPGAGAKAGGRERKPAMKRGRGGGGGAHANKSKAAAPGGKSKGKGAGAAHRAQSFYEVDEDADDFAGRGAAEAEEYDGVKGEFDDLPDDFEDEEIDEEEAFTEEDLKKYGDIQFERFKSSKKKKKVAKAAAMDDDDEEEDGFFDEDDDDLDEVDEDEDEEEEEEEEEEEDVMLESESEEPEEARADGGADLSEEEADSEDEEDGDEMDEDEDSEPASGDGEDDEDEDEDEDEEEDEEARAALVSDIVGDGRARKRRLKRGITEHGIEGEFGLGPAVGSAAERDLTDPGAPPGLSIASLMASAGEGAAAAAIGASRRRLDRLANKKARPDAVPLPRVVNERIERKAAYETTTDDVKKWQPIVKENREKPTLNFVGQERAKMHRKKSLAAINTDFVPETDFEKEIMAHLKEANALTGQDVERAVSFFYLFLFYVRMYRRLD